LAKPHGLSFEAATGEHFPFVATRGERREENQQTFQAANQRLHDIVDGRLPESSPVAFICECADDTCFERVEVALGEWADIAERPDRYLIVAGHPRVEGEDVVDTLGPYEIVEKNG
jgi:hypothetical protein